MAAVFALFPEVVYLAALLINIILQILKNAQIVRQLVQMDAETLKTAVFASMTIVYHAHLLILAPAVNAFLILKFKILSVCLAIVLLITISILLAVCYAQDFALPVYQKPSALNV